MKSTLLIFPGSNCDKELQTAITDIGSIVTRVWHKETDLPSDTDVVFIPGGFSYGDYLRPGAIAANSRILRSVKAFSDKGGYIVGICNGFQILLESGLLPGALMRNVNQKFICKNEFIKVSNTDSIFTKNFSSGEIINFPIAHNDGNYFCSDDDAKSLMDSNRIPFLYENNDNGSKASIAGVLSKNKRVLGLMPHPERASFQEQGGVDGKRFFNSMLENI